MRLVRILHQDDDIVVVEKPAGLQVHPPERPEPGAAIVNDHLVKRLRNQTGKYIYPVHRLDRATSGVMVFAFSSESASKLQSQFRERTVEKTYVALARGWLEADGVHRDEEGGETHFECLHRFEVDRAVGKFEKGRYSLVIARPRSGKLHQIRRHLKSQSHPIVGDTVYGDGKHNRLWRELVPGSTLYLKAYALKFRHPMTNAPLSFRCKWGVRWHLMFERCGCCPLIRLD